MAIVTAPFSYAASVQRKGKRAATKERWRGEVLVDIQELDHAAAPVAVLLPYPTIDDTSDIRFDGESFWRPLFDSDLCPVGLGAFEEALAFSRKSRAGWFDNPFPHETKMSRDKGVVRENVMRLDRVEDVDAKRVVESDLDIRKGMTARAALDLRIIGGAVYRRCCEPIWRIRPQTIDFTLDGPNEQERVVYVRFDRKAEAKRIAQRLSKKLHLYEDFERGDVVWPEALSFDDTVANARTMVSRELSRMAQAIGALRSIHAIHAWADLRELADEWDGKDHDGAVAIMDAARAFSGNDLTARENRLDFAGEPMDDGPVESLYFVRPLNPYVVAHDVLQPNAEMSLADARALAM